MSCGHPHDVDCTEVLGRIYVFIDQELVEDDGTVRETSYTTIEQHLRECGPCLAEYDLERLIKTLVARACGCEHASDELRSRILARIQQASA